MHCSKCLCIYQVYPTSCIHEYSCHVISSYLRFEYQRHVAWPRYCYWVVFSVEFYGYSDQCRYSVVTGGDVIARLTCREMLFSSLYNFVMVVSLRWCLLWMGYILPHFRFPDLAYLVLVLLCWLLADLLELHCLYFHRSLASLPWLVYFLLLLGVLGIPMVRSLTWRRKLPHRFNQEESCGKHGHTFASHVHIT
jgi:hypothetical protein